MESAREEHPQQASERRTPIRSSVHRKAAVAPTRRVIQAKLVVGASNDAFEVEADRVATSVVRVLATDGGTEAGPAQRSGVGNAQQLTTPIASRIRRAASTAPGAAEPIVGAAGGEVDAATEHGIAASSGTPLEPRIRRSMEGAFGTDFSGVRVHTGATATRLNDRIQARAFTTGNDVFFRGGMPDTAASAGQHLLAHELTHVVQQTGGGSPVRRSLNALPSRAVIQRTGGGKGAALVDEAPPDLDALKARAKTLLDQKVSLKNEIDSLQLQIDLVVGGHLRGKRRAMQLRQKLLRQQLGKLDPQIAAIFSEIQPLHAAEVLAKEGLAQEAATKKAEAEALEKAEAERSAKAESERLRVEAEEKAKQDEAARVKAAEEQKKKEEEAAAKKRAEEEQLERDRQDAKLHTYAKMTGLSLVDLVEYLTTTPTWHTRTTLSDPERDLVREIEAFAATPGALATCGEFKADHITAAGAANSASLADTIRFLGLYNDAAGAKRFPFELDSAGDCDEALAWGIALNNLMVDFPTWVLAKAMDHRAFALLVEHDYIDDVCAYYTFQACPPVFMAENGADFIAYLQMRVNDGVDPVEYQTTGPLQPYIRNFHRFEKAALNQLATNYNDTTKVKPLTLILHTALDHNSAFHRDSKLTAAITNPKNLTLLVEGGATLADYQAHISVLAKAHGNNDKLDQVMFAGHGASRSMELAGGIAENTYKPKKYGTTKQVGEDIDLDKKPAETLAFFNEILDNMDKSVVDPLAPLGPAMQANRRILFNACLTNSNEVKRALTDDQAVAQTEIEEYITNNASLATYMRKHALLQGNDVVSLGANASIGTVELMDQQTGELVLKSTADPEVTATKLVYLEKGTEPHGALLAALEAWSEQPAETILAMTRRVALQSPKWDDAVVEGAFKVALKYATNAAFARILQKLADSAHAMSEIPHKDECRVAKYNAVLPSILPKADFKLLTSQLRAADGYTSNPHVKLVLNQVHTVRKIGTAGRGNLLGALGTFDAKTARDYIDIPYLVTNNELDPLMAEPVGTAAKKQGLKVLAVMAALELGAGVPASVKTYLRNLRKPGAPLVPGLAKVALVEEIREQPAPRAVVPKVEAVPGRAKVDEIGKRPMSPAVPDLPELPELAEVKAPTPPVPTAKTDTTAETDKAPTPTPPTPVVMAPGRPARAGRDEVAEIPLLKPYFDTADALGAVLAKRATEEELLGWLA